MKTEQNSANNIINDFTLTSILLNILRIKEYIVSFFKIIIVEIINN